jgi:hypothetical protein
VLERSRFYFVYEQGLIGAWRALAVNLTFVTYYFFRCDRGGTSFNKVTNLANTNCPDLCDFETKSSRR